MRSRLQRQPFLARLAPGAHPGTCAVILRRDAGLAIGIGAAVRRICNDLADVRVSWATPHHLAATASSWQVEPLLQEPQESLTVVRPVAETAGCAIQAAKGRLAGGH